MRVFVTGAPGFIGQAVTKELLAHGHQVSGLARSDKSADIVTTSGADIVRGDIKDVEVLKSSAKAADGVIHLAFNIDFSKPDFMQAFKEGTETDQAAIQAMAEAMAGTGKPLVITSGTLHLPKDIVATEDTEPDWNHPFSIRGKAETMIKTSVKDLGVRGTVVRPSPTVHGSDDKGFVPMMTNFARKNGFATYVGDGSGRWPAVHKDDIAVLYRLALEKGTAGSVYHGVAEQGVPTRDTVEAVARQLKLPVETKAGEEAVGLVGLLAHLLPVDNTCSSEKTQNELDWKPRQPGLIADVEANYPF